MIEPLSFGDDEVAHFLGHGHCHDWNMRKKAIFPWGYEGSIQNWSFQSCLNAEKWTSWFPERFVITGQKTHEGFRDVGMFCLVWMLHDSTHTTICCKVVDKEASYLRNLMDPLENMVGKEARCQDGPMVADVFFFFWHIGAEGSWVWMILDDFGWFCWWSGKSEPQEPLLLSLSVLSAWNSSRP